MIKGIGVDTVQISRIQEKFDKFGISFAERILGLDELKAFHEKKSESKIRYLAKRFAAKEAIVKALGCGIGRPYRFTDIQVLNLPSGAPYVIINPKYDIFDLKIHISLTDDPLLAIAFAVISE